MDWETGDLTEPEQYRLTIGNRTLVKLGEIEERWLRLTPVSLLEWRWLTAEWTLRQHGIGRRLCGSGS